MEEYGRQRTWPVPFLDRYLVALALPTPDGYIGLLQYGASSLVPETMATLSLLATRPPDI